MTSASLPDIQNRSDLVKLVNRFYERVRTDDRLGPIFDEVAQVNWSAHLPKMYDFWDTVLFRAGTFRGNPLEAHAKLVSKADMGRDSFDRWLHLFRDTVGELFSGTNAEVLLRSAEDMANVIYSRINNVPNPQFDPSQLTPEQRTRYASYREQSTQG